MGFIEHFGSLPPLARAPIHSAGHVGPRNAAQLALHRGNQMLLLKRRPPVGNYVPEAVETVISAGATIENYRKAFGSLRWRYFGPRALVEDNSVRSDPTSLFNLQLGYRLMPRAKVALNIFNLFNAPDSDIGYYYASRLPGEPLAGIDDIHTHPTLPRTARVSLIVGF